MSVRVLQGDCRDVLRTLADASVHCVCTSPPYYGLRDYGTANWDGGDPDHQHDRVAARNGRGGSGSPGKQTAEAFPSSLPAEVCSCGARRIDAQIGLEQSPDEYVTQMVAVFREVRRVLRDDGTCWVNLGDSYASGEIGRHDGGRTFNDTYERKSFGDRQQRPRVAKPKDLLMMPARVALALQSDSWFIRSQLPWIKRSCMPESCTDRPTSAIEYVFLLTKSPTYYWDALAVAQQGAIAAGVRAAKGSNVRSELKDVNGRPPKYWEYTGTRNFRNSDLFFDSLAEPHGLICDANGDPLALDVNPAPFAQAHFATFPARLVEPLIKASTSERGCCANCGAPLVRVVEREVLLLQTTNNARSCDQNNRGAMPRANTQNTTIGWAPSCQCNAPTAPATVLDPFGGAGTTGLVASRLRRDAVLIELNADYVAMAQERIDSDMLVRQGDMFMDVVAPAPLFAEAAE